MKADGSLTATTSAVFWPLWLALLPLFALLLLLATMTAGCFVRFLRCKLQTVKSERSCGVISGRLGIGHRLSLGASGVHDHHCRESRDARPV